MKHLNIFSFFILSFFILSFFIITSNLKAQTVYITETGKKYHSKNCEVVKTGKKGIELTEAKKIGYEPCKICKENQKSEVLDKPKDKKVTEKSKK